MDKEMSFIRIIYLLLSKRPRIEITRKLANVEFHLTIYELTICTWDHQLTSLHAAIFSKALHEPIDARWLDELLN